MEVKKFEGLFTADLQEAKIAIICAKFNEFIVNQLEAGALEVLRKHGVQSAEVYYVAGALEIPILAKKLAETGKYHAIVALGAVIRGSTPHFDIVIAESAKGLSQVALNTGLPVINGILTTNNIEQAIERAGTKAGNKGADCARVALDMISLLGQIK